MTLRIAIPTTEHYSYRLRFAVAFFHDLVKNKRSLIEQIRRFLPWSISPAFKVTVEEDADGSTAAVEVLSPTNADAVWRECVRGYHSGNKQFLVTESSVFEFDASRSTCRKPYAVMECAGCPEVGNPGVCSGVAEVINNDLKSASMFSESGSEPAYTETISAARKVQNWFVKQLESRELDLQVVSWRTATGVFVPRMSSRWRRVLENISLSDDRISDVEKVIAAAAKTRSVRDVVRKKLCQHCTFGRPARHGVKKACDQIFAVRSRPAPSKSWPACGVHVSDDQARTALQEAGAELSNEDRLQLAAALVISGHRIVIPALGARKLLVGTPAGVTSAGELTVSLFLANGYASNPNHVTGIGCRHGAGVRLADILRLNPSQARWVTREAKKLVSQPDEWWGLYSFVVKNLRKIGWRAGWAYWHRAIILKINERHYSDKKYLYAAALDDRNCSSFEDIHDVVSDDSVQYRLYDEAVSFLRQE